MQGMQLYGGMVCSLRVCTRIFASFGKKDILQCMTKWMAKNTVPITIWGVPVWLWGGRQKSSHLGTPHYHNHKVFVTIWGLISTPGYEAQKLAHVPMYLSYVNHTQNTAHAVKTR